MGEIDTKLVPAVGKPRPRLRRRFVVALLTTAAAGLVTLVLGAREPVSSPGHGTDWWTRVGPHCTPLEVELTLHDAALDDGERAICLAIAGKIDRARALLAAMSDPTPAVNRLFMIAHPIADAGDDRSAGPIMGLVVEFLPANYMAVFHAGMAEFALGNDAVARAQLERFLVMYVQEDIWRSRARNALAGIAAHAPLDQREAHFPE